MNEKTDATPELTTLINRFRDELGVMNDTAHVILDKVYQIKDFREPKEDDSAKLKENPNSSWVDEFTFLLQLMKKHNDTLLEARRGLTRIVG